ncbi:hypothetical protein V6N12_013298 [Hibiscus sabdariffa]|uniref:Uncharacterized protein n=1 Tax=Hibiscus sabdariffa TaxID=183260 RepID=A0ABR2D8W4_9ROSI
MRRLIGVVEEEKLEILRSCAFGYCRHPFSMLELAKEFRAAGLEGFTVMRVSGSLVLLMFINDDQRRMWEENRMEDLRVLEVSSMSRSWSNEEEAGIVTHGDGFCMGVNGLKEVVVPMNEVLEGTGDIRPLSVLPTILEG